MTEDEKRRHLANLQRLARADGSMGARECLLLLEIEDEIKAGIVACNRATDDSRSDPQSMQPNMSGDLQLDLQLLTDLYTIGFVDETLDSAEQQLIAQFKRTTALLESEDEDAFEQGQENALRFIESLLENRGLETDEPYVNPRGQHIANLYRVALADGEISGRELLVILDTERRWFVSGIESVDAFNRAETKPEPDKFGPRQIKHRHRLLTDLYAVAAADQSFLHDDEQISPEEEAVIHGILCPNLLPYGELFMQRIADKGELEAEKRILNAVKVFGPG